MFMHTGVFFQHLAHGLLLLGGYVVKVLVCKPTFHTKSLRNEYIGVFLKVFSPEFMYNTYL